MSSGSFAGSLESARSQYSSELSSAARASNAQNQVLQKQYEAGLADHLSKGTPIPSKIIDKMRQNDRDFQNNRIQIDNTFTRRQAQAKNELKKEIAAKLLGKPLPPEKNSPKTAVQRKEERNQKIEMRKQAKKMSKSDAKVLKKAMILGLKPKGSGKSSDKDDPRSEKDRKPAANGKPSYISTSGPARDTLVLDGSGVPKEIEFSGPAAKPATPSAGAPAPVQKY